jgi:Asp-tRNA(Asn)/Glu-tRNA(Gln) amidotransferase A subunit family amidase
VGTWPTTPLSPVEAVDHSLARIEQCDPGIRAWVHVDAQAARRSAATVEATHAGAPLAGMPLGIKDTIDVRGMPCERGSLAYRGRTPIRDAELVSRLRRAGAIIAGKTVTTELAVVRPGATRNPWDVGHTPGGSSSGSAAAVAAGMVPAAIGTQTIGSTLRPASYCGVIGFKPSHGRVPLDGVLSMSPIVDAAGILAASVDIAEAVMRVLDQGNDAPNPTCGVPAAGRGTSRTRSVVIQPTPWWDRAAGPAASAVHAVRERLESRGSAVITATPADWFDDLLAAHWAIVRSGIADAARREPAEVQSKFGDEIASIAREHFDPNGSAAADATRALNGYRERVDELFQGADVLCTPCVTGEAPPGLDWTGDPIFCQPWSALGLPAISIPVGIGPSRLPVSVQLVGRANSDYDLLAFARDIESNGWPSLDLDS